MKHNARVTAILVAVFIVAQLLGLALIALGTDVTKNADGTVSVAHTDTALGPRPETTGFASFTYIVVGVLVGTIVLLILIRFKLGNVWKIWFFLAVWMAMTVSLGAIISSTAAIIVAFALALWKIFKPNMIVHNLTEVFIYSGIGLLIVPILDLFYVTLLLIVVAIYDAYAVWHSKHMVAMAQFQTDSKLFAGLVVPYGNASAPRQSSLSTTASSKKKSARAIAAAAKTAAAQPASSGRNAILGGGDIAFPMLFCGVVFDTLLTDGFSMGAAFGYTTIVVASAASALTLLFIFAKKDTFYPAMPFISAGCFAGFGLLKLALFFR